VQSQQIGYGALYIPSPSLAVWLLFAPHAATGAGDKIFRYDYNGGTWETFDPPVANLTWSGIVANPNDPDEWLLWQTDWSPLPDHPVWHRANDGTWTNLQLETSGAGGVIYDACEFLRDGTWRVTMRRSSGASRWGNVWIGSGNAYTVKSENIPAAVNTDAGGISEATDSAVYVSLGSDGTQCLVLVAADGTWTTADDSGAPGWINVPWYADSLIGTQQFAGFSDNGAYSDASSPPIAAIATGVNRHKSVAVSASGRVFASDADTGSALSEVTNAWSGSAPTITAVTGHTLERGYVRSDRASQTHLAVRDVGGSSQNCAHISTDEGATWQAVEKHIDMTTLANSVDIVRA
jgi:hypothetical protein